MKIICDACQAHLGEVSATARLILTVHCAFCGKDFGLAVDAPPPPEVAPSDAGTGAPPA
jgi:hypothetical protein